MHLSSSPSADVLLLNNGWILSSSAVYASCCEQKVSLWIYKCIHIYFSLHIKTYRFILGVRSHYGCQISIFPQLLIWKTTFSILRFLEFGLKNHQIEKARFAGPDPNLEPSGKRDGPDPGSCFLKGNPGLIDKLRSLSSF